MNKNTMVCRCRLVIILFQQTGGQTAREQFSNPSVLMSQHKQSVGISPTGTCVWEIMIMLLSN